jgi:hypothetical protein
VNVGVHVIVVCYHLSALASRRSAGWKSMIMAFVDRLSGSEFLAWSCSDKSSKIAILR